MAEQYWLMKTEPDTYSIDDLKRDKTTSWVGVRNYTSRNFMRDTMKLGDLVLFYHSSCPEPGVAGIASISKTAHPDPSQFDPKSPYFDAKATPTAPRWFLVDLKFKAKAKSVVPLSVMREMAALKNMELFRLNRLSITPVRAAEWNIITRLKEHW